MLKYIRDRFRMKTFSQSYVNLVWLPERFFLKYLKFHF